MAAVDDVRRLTPEGETVADARHQNANTDKQQQFTPLWPRLALAAHKGQ